jgi:hypothetical protein
MQQLGWRKSRYSGAANNCVEVAPLPDGAAVRDSKDPTGAVLAFTAAAWSAFTAGIRADDFQ